MTGAAHHPLLRVNEPPCGGTETSLLQQWVASSDLKQQAYEVRLSFSPLGDTPASRVL